MDNNLINKLDETVKSTLSKYEAPLNSVDWAQMESMLDAAPNNNSLRRSNSPVILFAVVVLAVGFILYFVLRPSNTEVKVEETKLETKVVPVVAKPKPVITHTMVGTPVVPIVKKDSNLTEKKDTLIVSKNSEKKDKNTKKETKPIEKKTADKVTAKKTPVEPTEKKDKNSSTQKKEAKTTNDVLDVELDADDLRLEKALKKEALAKKEAQLKKEKAIAKKEALKKEKAAKKDVKPAVNASTTSDTVHIDDENDSNRKSMKAPETVPVENKVDTSKSNKEKGKSGNEKKKSKKDRKSTVSDSAKTKKSAPEMVNP